MNTTPLRPVQRSEPVLRGRESPADAAREPLPGSLRPASLAAFEEALRRAGVPRVPAGRAHACPGKEASRHRGDGRDDRDEQRDEQRDTAGVTADAAAASPWPTPTLPHAPTPTLAPTPLALAVPTAAPLQAAAEAPTWSARAPRPLDAVSTHLHALASVPGHAVPGEWALQLLDRSLPVQQLDVQRSAAGALRVALSASPETTRNAPLDRLRQRLVARGHAPESLVYRHAHEELEP